MTDGSHDAPLQALTLKCDELLADNQVLRERARSMRMSMWVAVDAMLKAHAESCCSPSVDPVYGLTGCCHVLDALAGSDARIMDAILESARGEK